MTDGGWNLTGTGDSDADITAMALQALAKYQDQKAVKTATDKALYLAFQSAGQQGRLRLLGHDERRIRRAGRGRPL